MSKVADIEILHRPHLISDWIYPKNIHLIPSGRQMDARQQEKSSYIQKIFFFLEYIWRLRCLIINKKPNIVILYDPIPLFAYYLIKWTIAHKPFIWYHNHDVAEINKTRKYSIGWFSVKLESKMFPSLNLFTLPSLERKPYFPIHQLKGQFLFLPNLPNKEFYLQFIKLPKTLKEPIRLLYQGSISEGHGLENIIQILTNIIDCRKMELHLAGRISEYYKKHLLKIAAEYDVLTQVIFHGIIPYRQLPSLTIICDIGIAIHEPRGIIYQTGGTASNKIYEYAACGLPILYFRNKHYNQHLGKFIWAIPTDLKEESLKYAIEHIYNNYAILSANAKHDFTNDLNFEKHFVVIMNYLKSSLLGD